WTRPTGVQGRSAPATPPWPIPPWPIYWPLRSGRTKRTLALRINIDAKVAELGGAQWTSANSRSRLSEARDQGFGSVARDMIRISTIFIAICMVLVAASLGLILYSMAGLSGMESATVALTALTFLILYNAVSMRLRDRTDVGGQIADLSRGTADLARPVGNCGRRLAAIEGRVGSQNSAGADRIQNVVGEINELGVLVKQLAVSVAGHEELLAAGAAAAASPAPANDPQREPPRA